MTTGEKIAELRRRKGYTQEKLAEILNVSRQSVSRWEMDMAFPETEKLIKLGRLLECSIDFLLNEELQFDESLNNDISVMECFKFLHECAYFYLATSVDNKPRIRPMGLIYSDNVALYIATDKRKKVYLELLGNPYVEISSYNLRSGRWIRINGRMKPEFSDRVCEEMMIMYPMIKQEFVQKDEIFLSVFKLAIESISIH